jgi:hypothetical protein
MPINRRIAPRIMTVNKDRAENNDGEFCTGRQHSLISYLSPTYKRHFEHFRVHGERERLSARHQQPENERRPNILAIREMQ